ncbi:MAG: SsrA-binding protein SmpB [Proteobacteria bacterium]|nr:MAG: SsrA-binding protein SmpB [Pseudomonadota bacterium]
MSKKDETRQIIANNKDARFRYFIHETMEAGMVLLGTEVKSLRTGKVGMADAYVFVKDEEAYVSNLHISEYSHGNRENHAMMRTRKLLLHRKEIDKLKSSLQEDGMTIVAVSMYFDKGRAKLEIGIAKGKKLHDKRDSMKEKDAKREMDRVRKR